MKYFEGWSKRKKLKAVFYVALSLPLVCLLIVFLVINPIKIVNEKRTLNTYKSQLSQTKDEIVKVAGTPDSINYDESCRYSSAKYEKGNLSCNVSYYASYNEINASEANAITKKIADMLGSSDIRNLFISEETMFNNNDPVGLTQEVRNLNSSDCGISYHYGEPIKIYKDLVAKNPSTSLQIDLSCSKDATVEHYRTK